MMLISTLMNEASSTNIQSNVAPFWVLYTEDDEIMDYGNISSNLDELSTSAKYLRCKQQEFIF